MDLSKEIQEIDDEFEDDDDSVASDMIDGTCCSYCGLYFKDKKGNLFTHGYSVLCKDCWKPGDDLPKALTITF